MDSILCRCNCGYTCHRRCGLEILACIEQHWVEDCDHQWNGPWEELPDGGTVTCSKCGISACSHDTEVGP